MQRLLLFLLLWLSPITSASTIFGYEGVFKILEEHKPTSVEAFLSHLPAGFRSKFVLLHQSQSQNRATLLSPRMIFFNQDASLLMAVGGDKNGFRGDHVELIHFNDFSRKFEPTEIEFSKEGSVNVRRNPKTCYQCHGKESFHPIWRTYDTWPGAFGATHGGGIPSRTSDRLAYLGFLASARLTDHERFRWLENPPLNVGKLGRRNAQLTALIARKNAERIARIILDGLADSPRLYAPTIAALLGEAFLFTDILRSEGRIVDTDALRKHEKEIAKALVGQHVEKRKLLFKMNGLTGPFPLFSLNFEKAFAQRLAMLKSLEARGAKLLLGSWATTLKDSEMAYALPVGTLFKDVAILLLRYIPDDSLIRARFAAVHKESLFNSLKNSSLSIGTKVSLLDLEAKIQPDCEELLVDWQGMDRSH